MFDRTEGARGFFFYRSGAPIVSGEAAIEILAREITFLTDRIFPKHTPDTY